MSGNWYDAFGNPRAPADPNAPTPGADSWQGTEYDDFGTNEAGEQVPVVNGGEGNDTLSGLGGRDQLAGNDGDDSLFGGVGDDDLSGGPGNDLLDGGVGDDFMDAQPGDDIMVGGAGHDTVVFNGTPEEYVWTAVEGGWSVVDIGTTRVNSDGTDFVADDVEWVQYNNNGSEPTGLAAPCFVAGTRIMTAQGEVAVEMLRAGDLVVTLGLQGPWLRPVRWVGRRRVDCRRHPRPDAVLPVRITAGALGAGVPRRDLLVSPDHALYVDRALVPAAALVDGVTVLREVAARRVLYFHIELDAHDVLLAEGAPAESWLDCGNRAQFDNAGLVVALHADFAVRRTETLACADRVEDGPALARIRARRADAAAPTQRREERRAWQIA